VEFFLNTEKDRIRSVSYLTEGCLNTNACANTVAHLVEGRSIEAAWEITPEAVIAHLQTLPAESHHCAELAVGAFYKALADLTEKTRRPWKKLYR
jgi:nitrogen fixation NifU-like protein